MPDLPNPGLDVSVGGTFIHIQKMKMDAETRK